MSFEREPIILTATAEQEPHITKKEVLEHLSQQLYTELDRALTRMDRDRHRIYHHGAFLSISHEFTGDVASAMAIARITANDQN